MKKNLIFIKENLIAHRGMHNINQGIPENSMIAFEKAIENNYIIELDLHVLKDKTIVVFHDDNLKRMTGLDKNICDTTYEEIKNLKLNNTNNYIPLFVDVLKLVQGKVPILIEFKYDTKVGLLETETMKILKDYNGKYAIQSFNPVTINWFKKMYPNVIRGQLSCDFTKSKINILKKVILKNMLFNFITRPDFISFDIESLPSRRVTKYKGKKPILAWVIKNKEQMNKAKRYCDNYICENIEEL